MPNIIRQVSVLPVKRERYHMCIPGQMVSCMICIRLSVGSEGPKDTQMCLQGGHPQWSALGMPVRLVVRHIS